MSVLLIFIDGVGIGARDEHNPFFLLDANERSPLGVFANDPPVELPHGGRLAVTDACLGVEGRPQSASGQTTILTGVNIPALLGYHKPGFPNARMREVLREYSLFLRLARAGIDSLCFANAYSPLFFQKPPRWSSATTIAVESAGMTLRTFDDMRRGAALYHDWSNRTLIARGEDLLALQPDKAAAVLARLAAAHRFTLYEFFLTDVIGHKQDMPAAREILAGLNRFLVEVLSRMDLHTTTVIVTSDHGNVEDLSVRTHTRNSVPTLVWGARRDDVRARVHSLADITPTIFDVLASEDAGSGFSSTAYWC